jgi:hypothetical protein
MPKLVASRMVRLYGVSKKPGKREEYKLMQFDNDAFNNVFDEAEIGDILTDLVNDLYGQEEGNRWFLIADYGDTDEDEMFRIEIDQDPLVDIPNFIEIPNITDLIDFGSGVFQFFILVNGRRTEYQWIISEWQGKIYSG